MKKLNTIILILLGMICTQLYAVQLNSIYPLKPNDSEAFYFTPENYPIKADGKMDVSDALQAAINQVKKEKNFGILFIPEGKYKISKTIYIPTAIRLIGYGKNRPEFILAKNSPGFQEEVADDKGKAKYMFWFTGAVVKEGEKPRDAGASTFYSAMSNINLRIEDGNPHAVALRTHFAQHSFISYVAVYIGKGKAGLFDVGNELENVAFYGGDYGIYTTKASPGWPVMMVDSYFEGQRVAALRCQESGLAMVNLYAKNVPAVFDIDPNYCDKLFLENSYFENVSGPAVVITNENNSNNQITFRNVYCKNVPTLAKYTRSNTATHVAHKIYKVKSYDHGLQMDNMVDMPEYETLVDIEPIQKMPVAQLMDIPALPAMATWVNLRELGAKGDGETDDTKAIQEAIDKYDNIYVPQGWYRITYAVSIEHHVRNEVRFNKVSNWKVYCMQTEEESRESTDCQPIEMDDCKDVTFANLYMFRVIRVNEPYHSSVRIRNCENIAFLNLHNYSQIKYTNNIAVFDVNKDIDIRPWELSRLIVTGKEPHQQPLGNEIGKVNQLASDLEFAEGIARDSKGNIYFCDHRMRRIFKWSVETNSLSLLADFPWKPSNLAFDSEDNLLVLFRYDAQPGYLINGKPEEMPVMPDTKGTSFSGYGNSAYTMRVYSIDPENPEETIKLLPRVPMGQVKNVYKALYPSNRWRDFHDFNAVSVYVPEMCFLAPDGKTIIPHYFDLSRSSSLLEAYPGKPFYTSDEYDRRMVKMDVANDGTLSNLSYFVEQGEFGSAVDKEGNLYVADGEIYVFDKDGKKKGMIRVPERPSTLQFGGKDGNTLFVTGRSKFFGVRIK